MAKSPPYLRGVQQRAETKGYKNPFPSGTSDFVAFACGWSHEDARLWKACCDFKARSHVGSI